MPKLCCIRKRALEPKAADKRATHSTNGADLRTSGLSSSPKKPLSSTIKPHYLGLGTDVPSSSSAHAPAPEVSPARITLLSNISDDDRATEMQNPASPSPAYLDSQENKKRTRSILKSKLRSTPSKSSAETRRVIARSYTDYVETPHSRDVIHGLTDENRKAYKECLLRLSNTPEWTTAFESKNPPAKILYMMEPGNNKVGWLYGVICLKAAIVPVLAPTFEVEMWPKWHPFCTKHAKTGSSSTWHFQSHYAESMAFGAFKAEQNTRTLRWINETQGFLLQNITTVNPGEDGYVAPSKLTRQKIEADLITMSPNPQETLMIQRIRVELPFAIPSLVQKFVFSTLAPKMIKQMTDNATMVNNPKQPYMRLIEEDKVGIYAYMHKLARDDAPRPVNIVECSRAFLAGTPVTGPVISDSLISSPAVKSKSERRAERDSQARQSPTQLPRNLSGRIAHALFPRRSQSSL